MSRSSVEDGSQFESWALDPKSSWVSIWKSSTRSRFKVRSRIRSQVLHRVLKSSSIQSQIVVQVVDPILGVESWLGYRVLNHSSGLGVCVGVKVKCRVSS